MSLSIISYLKQNKQIVRIVFYSTWMILNLVQAGLTNLIFDEAHYWVCAKEIDWGHFYSPPFIDVLIRAGYALFQSELGVRLFFALMSTAGLYLLEKLLIKEDLILYYSMTASLVFLQVIGILAAPDIPLFFFTITFYLLFRTHIEKENLITTLLLAINTALLLYTKYHGLMVIAFTFLANFRYLLTRWKSYLWIFLAVALFLPHILWQVENGYPTIMFHLFERPKGSPFELKNLLDFIPGQILFAGPFISIILFISLFKLRIDNRFERTLLFNLLAMYGFFLLISLYHHIEMNWTVIGIPPLIILSHKVISDRHKFQKWIYPIVIPSLIVALLLRIVIIFPDSVPVKRLQRELIGYSEWATTIKESGKDLPIVFTSRYQTASIYSFYSGGEKTYTLNPLQKSDYDLFGYEEDLQGKTVFLVSYRPVNERSLTIETNKGLYFGTVISNFRSYKKVKLIVKENPKTVTGEYAKLFKVKWENPYPYDVTFKENPEINSTLGYLVYKDGELVRTNNAFQPAENIPFKYKTDVIVKVEEQGEYEILFYLQTGHLTPYPVSRSIKFTL